MPPRRTRHKLSDIKVVYAALVEQDPHAAQERLMVDLRRRAIVGEGADLVLAASPLGTMLARRVRGAGAIVFTDEHYRAGEWFLRLYSYRNGGCKLKGALDDGGRGASTNEDQRRDYEFRAMSTDRRMAGRVNLLADVIVFGRTPRWLRDIIGGRDRVIPPMQAKFMAALEALRMIWLEFGRESIETLRDKCARQAQC